MSRDVPQPRSAVFRWLVGRAHQLASRPWRTAAWMLLLAVVAGGISSQLVFESSYLALLPEKAPEVQAIHEVRKHTGGTAELVLAVGGKPASRLPFAKRLAKRLNQRPTVQWAQVEFPVDFFERGGLLLLPMETLRRLQERLAEGMADAKRKANPMLVDLEADEPVSKQSIAASLERELSQRFGSVKRTKTTADGRYLLVLIKPNAVSAELAEGNKTLKDIKSVIASERRQGDGLTVRLGGTLLVNQAEHKTMSDDLKLASMLALILAVGLLTLVTRRISTLVVIGVPLLVGLLVTLALAKLMIGHLNLVSGFMVAALVGLGVDFGIHLYLRYLDERAADRDIDTHAAMRRAIDGTLKACLTAALTTSAAFFALLAADFRGFSEYGLIAGVGVLVMLLVTFAVLPAVALLVGPRNGNLDRAGRRRLSNTRQLARPLAWAMVAGGLALVLFTAFQSNELRFYNHFKRLKGTSAAVQFDDYLTREMGGSLAPALLMVDDLQQARRAEAIVKKQMANQGMAGPLARVASLASLVPVPSSERRELLAKTREQAYQALLLGDLPPADGLALRRLYEASAAEPWGEASVPAFFRSRLTARSGKHFLLLWPRYELEDDQRIGAWAAQISSVQHQLKTAGISALVLDENLIAARVISLIRADGPRVMVLAGLAVLLILIIDLRRFDRVLLVGSSVVLGLTTMLGLMVVFGMQLNLFNAVVLPTVLGIGIDNAVHLMHAYQARGRGSVPLVVATSGRAALLSSATTAIGFGSAIVAHHLGLHQMGVLALIGVGTTFLLSTVVLPSVLRVFEGTPEQSADHELEAETIRLPALPRPNLGSSMQPARISRSGGQFIRST